METDPTEIEAIRASQHGDLQAFNWLILRHQDFLFRVAMHITGDEDMASDAVQETCILVFKKISSYRDGSFRGWLARIVSNVCYDEFRGRGRHVACSLDSYTQNGDEIESPRGLADDSASPEAQVEAGELEAIVQACLKRISSEHQMILILVDIEGLSYEEASAALQAPIGTIKSRLARARAQMRETVRSSGDFLPGAGRGSSTPPRPDRRSPSHPHPTSDKYTSFASPFSQNRAEENHQSSG